ncbi:hypothetical protein M5J20_07655 [Corynebacterium sp. TA-R-1]|uniref:Uncharacterized protein n=1 Tax=Corynebacterium stercoris TaxID=2943490 RepID=A0ABT1G214_9CORY|nr:hypothetical protein [Corynebacterium stercoris]MCP1388066.1 hypothetical protein [Corynebacterium stercoris]
MRTETLHRKTQTTNPKYATTLTSHLQPGTAMLHQPARYRHKQRRPFIRPF